MKVISIDCHCDEGEYLHVFESNSDINTDELP